MLGLGRHLGGAVVLLVSTLGSASAGTQLQAAPSVALRFGLDTNLYLDARLINNPQIVPAADALLEVAPRLWLAVERGPVRLVAHYELLDRNALTLGSVILDQLASLRVEVRPGSLRLLLAANAERYDLLCGPSDTLCQPEDVFQRLGGEVSLGFSHPGRAVTTRAGAGYRFDVRHYPNRPLSSGSMQLDREHRASAWLQLAHPANLVGGEVRALLLHVDSPNPTADLDRLRGEVALHARPHPMVALGGGYGLAWQRVPFPSDGNGATRHDWIHEGWIDLSVNPWHTLELLLHADVLAATSDLESGRYTRFRLLAGVAVALDLTATFPRRMVPAPAPLAPLIEGRVTFSARAEITARVAIVGDWNGWDPATCGLAPVAERPGLFRGACDVPAGEHRYGLWVDGQIRSPPDAPRYVSDGFGGTNGVIVVP